MAVFVDPIQSVAPNAKWRYTQACHLIADSETELVAFAKSLGLKPEWIQKGRLLHFDLTPNKRTLAVRKGAIEITRRQLYDGWLKPYK